MNYRELREAKVAQKAALYKRYNRLPAGLAPDGYRHIAAGQRPPGARRDSPEYEARLAEVVRDLAEMRNMDDLREAMSTSDFPLLLADSLDRRMYASFKTVPQVWRNYIKVSNDITTMTRAVKRFRCTRGDGILADVPQGASYPADSKSESTYSFTLGKKGRRRDFTWELMIDDDLDALKSTPDDLGYQAANKEAQFASALYTANTTLFATTHAVQGTNYSNLATSTPLTPANLDAAVSTMGLYPHDDGVSPILNDPKFLVVGTKAMLHTALRILRSITLDYDSFGDTDTVRADLPTANIVPQEVRNSIIPLLDPFMRYNDSTNYATAWYLFSDPSNGYAVEMGFLKGYETPQLFMKNSNQVMLGGGMSHPMDGDFDTDAISYKARHVMGGSHTNAVGGWRFAYWAHNT